MGQDPPKRPSRVHGYQSLARIGQGPYRNVHAELIPTIMVHHIGFEDAHIR